MTPHFLFIDDSVGLTDDAQTFQSLLTKAHELKVSLARPDRAQLLAPEADAPQVDGYILDINLRDHVEEGQDRFVGSGAGLAQDLRILQTEGPPQGQKARPIVRLCAAQVFQTYLEGDSTLDDVFDLGFSKETIADRAADARRQIASLVTLYEGLNAHMETPGDVFELLGLDDNQYAGLNSSFKAALEAALCRRVHEAAHFLLVDFLQPAGLLVDEPTLAVRCGARVSSAGWPELRAAFADDVYRGLGASGFTRWWAHKLLARLAQLTGAKEPVYRLPASSRVDLLEKAGFQGLESIAETPESPGDRFWAISVADDPELQLPVDPQNAFPLAKTVPPWLDEPLWCLEMARRKRRSPLLSTEEQERLQMALERGAVAGA